MQWFSHDVSKHVSSWHILQNDFFCIDIVVNEKISYLYVASTFACRSSLVGQKECRLIVLKQDCRPYVDARCYHVLSSP